MRVNDVEWFICFWYCSFSFMFGRFLEFFLEYLQFLGFLEILSWVFRFLLWSLKEKQKYEKEFNYMCLIW